MATIIRPKDVRVTIGGVDLGEPAGGETVVITGRSFTLTLDVSTDSGILDACRRAHVPRPPIPCVVAPNSDLDHDLAALAGSRTTFDLAGEAGWTVCPATYDEGAKTYLLIPPAPVEP